MNAKKAKALRRIARNATSNWPLVEYKPLKQTVLHAGSIHFRKLTIHLGHVEMVANCTRAVYQRLKKDAKRKLNLAA